MNAMESDNDLAIIPVDQGDIGQNYDDAMARRLKNRERQRRYRARKRLESDRKKADNTNDPAPPQRQVQINCAHNSGEGRILCRRNWKQDARRAHMVKQRQIVSNDPCNELQARLPGAVAGPLVRFENSLGNANEDETERRVVPGRRHWKADARNKKD